MEDGAVSIFGLVFGVAAGGSDSHAVVLAARQGARRSRRRGSSSSGTPEAVRARIAARLRGIASRQGSGGGRDSLTPSQGRSRYEEAIDLRLGDTAHQDPRARRLMFASDVIAASIR
jgi:hypothetical protein